MPNPAHGRLRIGGRLYDDAHWSIGVAVRHRGGGDPFNGVVGDLSRAQLEGWCNAVKALNSNGVVSSGVSGVIGTRASIDYIRAAQVGTNGREQAVAIVQGLGKTGSGGYRNPAQTALVVSLLTQHPGASYRGRMFLPALVPSIGTNGRLDQSDCASLAADVGGWLRQLAAAFPLQSGDPDATPIDPVVVSTRQNTATPITSVRVGNRLDSQRSRTEGEQEAYSSSAVAQ